jgi:general secretion pathway protein D
MYSLPLLLKDDNSIADLEWVTQIIRLENVSAPELVPIVRPLMMQAGHIAAIKQSNSILIVERYGNAKRVAEILQVLDQMASQTE